MKDYFFNNFELSCNEDANRRKLPYTDTDHAQILIRSNKITFDSRMDNITLSSKSNINIGSNINLDIYTNNRTLIESKNIYLGKKALENKSRGDRQSMVLGDEMTKLMGEMIDAIGQMYVPGVIFGVSGPVSAGGSPGWLQLQAVKTKLKNALSQHHYIEKNKIGGK